VVRDRCAVAVDAALLLLQACAEHPVLSRPHVRKPTHVIERLGSAEKRCRRSRPRMSRRHVRLEILELEQVCRPPDRPASFALHASPDRTKVLPDGQPREARECARGRATVGIDEQQPGRVRNRPPAKISRSACAQHAFGSQHGNTGEPGRYLGGSVR
jgi:hypothetical protein